MQVNTCFSVLIKIDHIADALPGGSSLTNFVDIFLKCVVLPLMSKESIAKSHYYTHLQNKSFIKCFILLIPVVGNIIVFCGIIKFENNENLWKNSDANAPPLPHHSPINKHIVKDPTKIGYDSPQAPQMEPIIPDNDNFPIDMSDVGEAPNVSFQTEILQPTKEVFSPSPKKSEAPAPDVVIPNDLLGVSLAAAREELEKGIEISDEIRNTIKQLKDKISTTQKDDQLIWVTSSVFKLVGVPNLIFKSSKNIGSVEITTAKRFANMIKAKQVCLAHSLDLLVIPHAKKIEVDGESFIAEEILSFDEDGSIQENHYQTYSKNLDEAVRQLAILIEETGLDDITWRNIPVLNEVPDFTGPRRIGLIDLEVMTDVYKALFEDCSAVGNSRGLIRCVSKEQTDIVIKEIFNRIFNEDYQAAKERIAKEDAQPVEQPDYTKMTCDAMKTYFAKRDKKAAANRRIKTFQDYAEKTKAKRLEELESDRQLSGLYVKNGIVTGREKIDLAVIETLELDLNETEMVVTRNSKLEEGFEKRVVTLRQVAKATIKKINALIQKSSEKGSLKEKRYVKLERAEESPPVKIGVKQLDFTPITDKQFLFNEYLRCGIPRGQGCLSKADEKKFWVRRIVDALVAKGHLHKLDKFTPGLECVIQA